MFINTRLSENVELGATRIEDDDIEITRTDGQWEVRNARHSQGLLEFNISFPTGEFADDVIASVKSMFKVARKSLHAFRFRDWTDYQLTDEEIGTGDGATVVFQIVKSWTVGSDTHSRKITRPVTPMVVKKDGVVEMSGYAIDYATGILTYSVAPAIGAVITVTGEFDIPVRFDTAMGSTGVTGWLEHLDTLTLVEVRE